LPLLPDEALGRALREGRDALAEAAGREIDLIAYPHGRADERVACAAREAGFRLGFVTGRAGVTADTDSHLVPRLVPPLSEGSFALRAARAVAGRT
jgi:peptidoglycan/xylan/chitin deacetylase (PgdA/CDA1 family)